MNIAAVILAAGESARFGKPKQLIHVGGKSLIRRAVDAARPNCPSIVVVIGSAAEEVTRELSSADVAIIENENWQRGIGTSIRAGVQHLIDHTSDVDGIALLVCDQPFVNSEVITQLIALRAKTGKSIIASSYENTLGVPALFDRSCFQELLALPDADGAKSVILGSREHVAEFRFPKGAIDIDTVEEWELLNPSS